MSAYTTLRARWGRHSGPAQLNAGTLPGLPPLVVRDGRETSWAGLEAEMAPVIAIMDRIGLTAAGFRLARRHEVSISTYGSVRDEGNREKLLLAREAIREAARADGTFWGLPNAILYFGGLVVELFGDGVPGQPWEYSAYTSVSVSLVPVKSLQS